MKIIFLGSSVTYGSAAGGVSFADILCEKNGYEKIKEAVSGTTLVDDDDQSYVSRLKRIEADSADLFICQLSTNDASQNKPLGVMAESKDINSFDVKTIAGAIEYIIAYVTEKWNCPIAFYTGTKYDSKAYAGMVSLLKEITSKWNIRIINLWDEPVFNSVSEKDYKKYMSDPIHPTLEGYREWWTPFIEKKVKEMLQSGEHIR
jgi:lysophospholipase L1-like esterase